MSKPKEEITTTTTSSLPISHEKLLLALDHVWDNFDRAHTRFILLDPLATCICNETPLTGDKVRIAIKKDDLNANNIGHLEQLLGIRLDKTIQKAQIAYFEGVAIHISVIQRNYKVFRDPQLRYAPYHPETFWLPNPMDEYQRIPNL